MAYHLAAIKVQAMKNDPTRRHQELADVASLLRLPDVDTSEVREQFARHRMLALWDEIEPQSSD